MTSHTRRVIVSGGGTGIGRAVAAAFVDGDHEVTILGRREDVLRRTAEEIGGDGSVSWQQVDLRSPDGVRVCADRLAEDDRPIDVLANVAGANAVLSEPVAARGGSGLDAVAWAWRANFESNVLTAVLLTEALLPRFRRPGGRVVSISSFVAVRGGPPVDGGDSYASAKAALHAWTLGLARQYGPDGITANVVAPGYVPDPRKPPEPRREEAWLAQAALPRVGLPSDIAAAVRHLAGAGGSYVTGQVLHVSGGAVMG